MPVAWIVGISVTAILLALLAVGSLFFYRISVGGGRRVFLGGGEQADKALGTDGTSGEAAPPEFWKALDEWLNTQPCETWNQTSADGLKLSACYIPPPEPGHRVAILLHGYSAHWRTMAVYARMYHTRGYGVLLPDARGHGESEGSYVGFGWPDRIDVLAWIRATIAHDGEARLVLHGVSMGAATVMMTGGETLPPQVKAIVEDCGYTSAWDELRWVLKHIFHLPAFPFLYATGLLTRIRAGYGFREASALRQAAKSCTPTLFIHGEADSCVPFEMVQRLYEACGAEKELYDVPDAGHGMAYAMAKEAYEEKVAKFVERFVDAPAHQ
jgi:fermentation-respiration switch protein FrsA (DUF1100 family)